ncbi:DUF4349 domain-containing protein [Arenimonas donghaensis]|uniref:DUF4349 domain-containing protein n=1 Tax=Arenimonas donghaensis DSM 18148 = HO3-R19 TaxID=1121014 RepID=A0A087MIY3_9GAMM|nr:DUF4349 domain-containing protein [Arenimonas donghaensis]KFL36836.1 hypothetical protein N788_04260 [Arenimonas donghaensis DSM 18148 = HO3-R19]
MKLARIVWVTLVLTLAVGCSDTGQDAMESMDAADAAGAAAMAGMENAPGEFLAYEHHARVRLPVADMPERVAAVRAACLGGQHGQCTVLGEDIQSGQFPSASLVLRVVPGGVEPLLGLAANGGELAQRSTRAEDLAVAVRDTSLRQARLRSQHARLLELMARPDARAEDLIAITRELAEIETQLQQAEQDAAQQQHRVRTNLLTLAFEADQLTTASSELGRTLGDVVSVLDHSAAVLVLVVVALLPFLVLALVVYVLVRAWRRRRRRVG